MRTRTALLAAMLICAVPASAQLGSPVLDGTMSHVLGTVNGVTGPLTRTAEALLEDAGSRAQARLDRLAELVRRNRSAIERDAHGSPARKGELLLIEPVDADVATAQNAGFTPLGRETMAALDLRVERLAVPAGVSLSRAETLLRARLPQATITGDTLHEPAGGQWGLTAAGSGVPALPIGTPVGLIDSGAATGLGAITRGFATGAPRPADHGSATASLLAGTGVRQIYVADVYGADPAGGNALAIARALDWLVGAGVRVMSISLVGPDNPLVGRAVAAARQRGAVIVAAVGNDGPGAPPAYPASYPGVLAVTGVDGRDRALIEAGRALHLDYSAPGADMAAMDARGRWRRVRGTSFAAPLVAARAAAALPGGNVIATLDHEAQRLGNPALYGRGLLCGACRKPR